MRSLAVFLIALVALSPRPRVSVSPCLRASASPRPPRASIITELTSSVVRLSQCRGAAARAEALIPAVEALLAESTTLAVTKEGGPEAAYLAGLALSLVERGLSTRILEGPGDDPADDLGLDRAAATATRTVEAVRKLMEDLPEDLRPPLAPVLERTSRKAKSASDAVVARMKRHGTMKAAPKEERPPSDRGREEGNPYR